MFATLFELQYSAGMNETPLIEWNKAEGRSYYRLAARLGISQSALHAMIRRQRNVLVREDDDGRVSLIEWKCLAVEVE